MWGHTEQQRLPRGLPGRLPQARHPDRNIGALNRRLTPPDPRITPRGGHPHVPHVAPPDIGEPQPGITPGL